MKIFVASANSKFEFLGLITLSSVREGDISLIKKGSSHMLSYYLQVALGSLKGFKPYGQRLNLFFNELNQQLTCTTE